MRPQPSPYCFLLLTANNNLTLTASRLSVKPYFSQVILFALQY